MTKDEALKLVLADIEANIAAVRTSTITAIKEALAQPQQEPVAWAMFKRGRLESFWMDKGDAYDCEFTPEHKWEPLYTSPPPQRPWVGLNDIEIEEIWFKHLNLNSQARAIEAKLKAKNDRP